MTPRFLTVLNGLSKSKSHLKEKVTPVFNTSYTLPHLPWFSQQLLSLSAHWPAHQGQPIHGSARQKILL